MPTQISVKYRDFSWWQRAACGCAWGVVRSVALKPQSDMVLTAVVLAELCMQRAGFLLN